MQQLLKQSWARNATKPELKQQEQLGRRSFTKELQSNVFASVAEAEQKPFTHPLQLTLRDRSADGLSEKLPSTLLEALGIQGLRQSASRDGATSTPGLAGKHGAFQSYIFVSLLYTW